MVPAKLDGLISANSKSLLMSSASFGQESTHCPQKMQRSRRKWAIKFFVADLLDVNRPFRGAIAHTYFAADAALLGKFESPTVLSGHL